MAFHIRDPETDALVRELAHQRAVGLTEAVRMAVSEALRSRKAEHERVARAVGDIQRRVARWPNTGPPADKAFFDSLDDG